MAALKRRLVKAEQSEKIGLTQMLPATFQAAVWMESIDMRRSMLQVLGSLPAGGGSSRAAADQG